MMIGKRMKTRVTDLLDAHGTPYRELHHDQKVMTIEMAAEQRGVNPDEMVKCILLRDSKKRYVMACLNGLDKLATQSVRNYVETSRLSFASPDEIQAVIGFPIGAVPPIAHSTSIPVVFDKKIKLYDTVNISSGNHLMGVELARNDLVRAVDNLIWGDICAVA